MDQEDPKPSNCRNCGAHLADLYCPRCGQRDLDFRRDWRGLVSEVSSTFLNLDGKVPRGLFALLFRPGLLTKGFLDGARASQIPPLRLYLFVSVCFFLLIAQSSDDNAVMGPDGAPVEVMVVENTAPEGAFGQWLVSKLDDPQAIREQFMVWLPRLFLIGVPLLALFLRVIFWKQPFVYLEYLVMALHFQSFMFLWILLAAGLSFLFGLLSGTLASAVGFVAIGWLVVYPIVAFRRLFDFSWLKATGYSLVLEVGYLLFFILLMASVGVTAVYFA